MTSVSTSISPRALLTAQIDLLCATMLVLTALDVFGTFCLAAAYWNAGTATILACWIGGNAVVQSAYAAAALLYRKRLLSFVTIAAWARSLFCLSLASGAAWGGALIPMIATGDPYQVMFVTCFSLGAIASSFVGVSYWPTYAAFVSPIFASIAAGFALGDVPGREMLATGALLAWGATLVASRRVSKQVLAAQRLAFANQALVDTLNANSLELKRAFDALEQVSRTDPLTGLANRRSRDERLEQDWARSARDGRPLTVIAIDVDHFKHFNDTHGHDEGDRCLQAVAEMLRTGQRGAFDMAARQGGEEFMLILPGASRDAGAAIAERVRAAVDRCAAAHGLPQRVTISLGVATAMPAAGGTIRDLTMAADAALYRAKMAGRNRCEIARSEARVGAIG